MAQHRVSPVEVSEIISEYIRDPGKFWPNADEEGYEQRQVKKLQSRFAKLARKSGKTADQAIAEVMGWAERRRSDHPPTVATPQMVNGLAGALCQLGRFREADLTLRRALAAGIDPRSIQSVFDSEVLRAQFLRRLPQEQRLKPSGGEWYRVAVGARRLRDASEIDAAVIAPSAISFPGRGRFANSTRRLANALEVAERFEIPRVYMEPAWYLDGDDPICFRGHEVIQSDAPSPEERLVLRGSFVHRHAFAALLSGTEKENVYLRLRELRPFTRFRDREPLGENDLVIHVRAGDVFRKRPVNPGYGQPPLAFYLTVLRQRRWRSVHLAYEDDGNPVIGPLLDHLREEGIEHTTVVTDLTSTIEYLLRAKTMVAGHGSFIPTIAGLSSNLHRLYTFEGGRLGRCPGVAQTDVIDARGDYRRAIMSRNWENRPDQVELMLHYPESALRVVPKSEAAH